MESPPAWQRVVLLAFQMACRALRHSVERTVQREPLSTTSTPLYARYDAVAQTHLWVLTNHFQSAGSPIFVTLQIYGSRSLTSTATDPPVRESIMAGLRRTAYASSMTFKN